jgi:hypothetical protein
MPLSATENGTLSVKQEKAIPALLTCSNQDIAAETAGVHPRTLKRWLAEDANFREAYRSARREAIDRAVGLLAGGMEEAVETLKRNLSARNASVQVRSAVALIELSLRAYQQQDLADRVAELERSAEDGGAWTW